MAEPLPFEDFLSVLRARNIPVGLQQRQEMLLLCEALGSTCNANTLGRGIGSLLGRSRAEVELIQDLFFACYSEAFQFPDYGPDVPRGVYLGQVQKHIERAHATAKTPEQRRKQRIRLIAWVGAVTASLLCVVLVLHFQMRTQVQPESVRPRLKPAETGAKDLQASLPVPPSDARPEAPRLPPPPTRIDWTRRLGVSLPWFLVLAGILYAVRRRQLEYQSRRAYWDEVRNQLPGTVYPELHLPDVAPPFERGDLEDMATLLGRSDDVEPSTQLDAEKTVQATLDHGGVPHLVFGQWRHTRTVIVLLDVSSDMRPWNRQVRALLDGLRIRGVTLVERYFAGEADRLSLEPDQSGASESLFELNVRMPDAALLVLSTGSGVVHSQKPGQRADWVDSLRLFSLRAWLHPIPVRKLWRPLLSEPDFPIRVLPMTRKGLIAAAYELAMDPERRLHIPDEATDPQREATPDEVCRLRRLLSVMVDPPVELADFLRQHFLPDVPLDAIARIFATSEDLSGSTISWSDERIVHELSVLRRQDLGKKPEDRLEEQVRRKLLEAIQRSQPEPGSRAHLEWQLWCALQEIHLHGPDDQINAQKTLRALLNGPLYGQVADALHLLGGVALSDDPQAQVDAKTMGIAQPVIAALRKEFPELIKTSAAGHVASIPDHACLPSGEEVKLVRWPLPGFNELAAGLGAVAVILNGLHLTRTFTQEIPHVQAYALRVQLGSPTTEQATIHVEPLDLKLTKHGKLCFRSDCSQSAPRNWDDGTIRNLDRSNTVDYHLRVEMPEGNLAYSNAIRVPKYVPPPPKSEEKPKKPKEEKKPARGWVTLKYVAAKGEPLPSDVKASITDSEKRVRRVLKEGQPIEVAAGTITVQVEDERCVVKGQLKRAMVETGGQTVVELQLSLKPVIPTPPPIVDRREPNLGQPTAQLALANLASPPAMAVGQMVRIPGGTFQMGSEHGDSDEKPVHPEKVATFLIDKYEVTMEQYQACVRAGGCQELSRTESPSCNVNQQGRDKHPVNCVNWHEASAYCRWRGGRLPTEAEWEYATKGPRGHKYPWGDQEPSTEPCWKRAETDGTCEIESKVRDKSWCGVMDLGGNVVEWVFDAYQENYATGSGPANGGQRVIRGGAWNNTNPTSMRAAYRFRYSPAVRRSNMGFRCAATE